jgi:hypothetical protein
LLLLKDENFAALSANPGSDENCAKQWEVARSAAAAPACCNAARTPDEAEAPTSEPIIDLKFIV